MILHLTAGSTHIALEIDAADGVEPRLSVLHEQLALPAPTVQKVRRQSPRVLTFAVVAIAAALGGYHFAPGAKDSQPVTQARAQPPYVSPRTAPAYEPPEIPASAFEPPQVPAQLRRELAGRPVITPPPAPSTPAKPGDSNPFGLE